MLALDKQFAASIESVSRALAEWTVQEMYERMPELEQRYGADGRTLWKGEIINRLQFLAEAIAADRAAIFVQSVEWARGTPLLLKPFQAHDLLALLRGTLERSESAPSDEDAARAVGT